jgi:hypothetical protein
MLQRTQRGMSLLGFIIVLTMVLCFAYLGLRLVPVYLEYYSVVSAMNGLASERGSAQLDPSQIRRKLLERLYLSYTDDNVGEENIRIVRRDGVNVRITYEVRKPIIGNVDVIAAFDKQVKLAN